MEWAAVIISGVSACLAMGSMLISLAAYRKDVPMLKIEPGHSLSLYEPAVLSINVTNVGRRPTTITEVGFRVDFPYGMQIMDKDLKPQSKMIQAIKNIHLNKEPATLKPGDMKKYNLVLTTWPDPMVYADFPLRPFAISSHGNTIWGEARPYLRMMLKGGWKPVGNTPEACIRPYNTRIKPMRIHAVWKLWKPKYLRK